MSLLEDYELESRKLIAGPDGHEEPIPGPAAQHVINAFDDLPIQCRIEYVKNLLLNHGGEKKSAPQDPVLVVAAEVLKGVLETLDGHPRAAQLRNFLPIPEP